MKLFDSEGVAFLQILDSGAKGIEEMRQKARQLGATITQDMADKAAQAADIQTNFNFALQSFSRELTIAVLPAINAVIASDVVALVMRLESIDILGTKEAMKGVYDLLEKPTFIVVNMVLPAQKAALSATLEKIFTDQPISYVPCLCDVKGYIAKGQQILIDEKLGYSEAILDVSRKLEEYNSSE